MIIKIAGTNGAGKSWVVRRIMGCFDRPDPVYFPGKKQPVGYLMTSPRSGTIRIIGHYEVMAGGSDRISRLEDNFDYAHEAAGFGYNVLFEGLFVGKEVVRTVALSKHHSLLCVFLNTTIEDCIRNVESRRRAIGKEPQTNNDQLRAKYKEVQSAFDRSRDAGVNCVKLSSVDAVERIKKEFGII